ncbi:MAG: hypothetical protein AAF790_05445 [Planctomycetota bacterium]
MTSVSGLEFDEAYRGRLSAMLGDVEVSVLSLADLRANKLASGRYKDLADLENLPEA